VFGEILHTTLSEKTPVQNALSLFIPDSYFRGRALNNLGNDNRVAYQ
jgi:hypothetical protein